MCAGVNLVAKFIAIGPSFHLICGITCIQSQHTARARNHPCAPLRQAVPAGAGRRNRRKTRHASRSNFLLDLLPGWSRAVRSIRNIQIHQKHVHVFESSADTDEYKHEFTRGGASSQVDNASARIHSPKLRSTVAPRDNSFLRIMCVIPNSSTSHARRGDGTISLFFTDRGAHPSMTMLAWKAAIATALQGNNAGSAWSTCTQMVSRVNTYTSAVIP